MIEIKKTIRIYPTKQQQAQLEVDNIFNAQLSNYLVDQCNQEYNQSHRHSNCTHIYHLAKKYAQQYCSQISLSLLNGVVVRIMKAYHYAYRRRITYQKGLDHLDIKPNTFNLRYEHNQIHIQNHHIVLSSKLSIKLSDDYSNIKIKYCEIRKTTYGRYYLVLCYDEDPITYNQPRTAVGIDLGIKSLLILSDGITFDFRHFENDYKLKLAKLKDQQKLHNKDSVAYCKLQARIDKLVDHIEASYRNYIHQITHYLVTHYDIICLEDLSVSSIRNQLGSTVIDYTHWTMLIHQLEYKAEKYGVQLYKIHQYYPSSQTCSCCGYRNLNLKDLSIRQWTCPQCNTTHDRDINAAQNILQQGLNHTNLAVSHKKKERPFRYKLNHEVKYNKPSERRY